MNTQIKWSILAVVFVCVVGTLSTGCAAFTEQQEDERPGDEASLYEEARSFQTNLLWARYDQAYDSVHQAYRPAFEGEFEERGDDYEIVELDMIRAELIDEGRKAHVEVEQQWYMLPSTVVEKERFVEHWVFEDQQWQIRERITRSEFRDRGEKFEGDDEVAAGDDGDDATQP